MVRLSLLRKISRTIGGFGRNDYFEYVPKFGGIGEIQNRFLVEVGTASGREPTELVSLQSYVGQFLNESKLSLGTDDETAFKMTLMHFRRTFVEKMFAIHSKVEMFKKTGTRIGGYARHYYDLFCLAERPEVLKMLSSDEYEQIKLDYDKVSRSHFEETYIPPIGMRFANSDALFPPRDLGAVLSSEFEKQCHMLCFGKFPTWLQVQRRFKEMRELI